MGPYKYRFRRILSTCIEEVGSYNRVLDLASANAKFRKYFCENALYVGADISESAFSGLEADEFNEFKVGDIASKPFFLSAEEPFDLIVSTHTFKHLEDEKKKLALANLVSVTRERGNLILELTNDDVRRLSKDIDASCILVRRIRYRGIFSSFMQNRFSKIFHRSPIGRKINWLLSFVDPPPFADSIFLLQKKRGKC